MPTYTGGDLVTHVNRLNIDNSATPAEAPFRITPSIVPTGTMAAGDIYLDSTTNAFKVYNGTVFANPGSVRAVKNAAATLTAADSGALCVWSTAAGYLYTLPAPVAGLWYDFVVVTTITSSAAKVITAAATDFLFGSFLQIPDTAAQIVARAADGTSIRAWSGNGSTTGGYAGDSFRLTAINTTQWAISGIGLATGTEATPFATS